MGAHTTEGRSYLSKGEIVIGNHVWTSHNSTLMTGVLIGDGCVFATNLVVTKKVYPYTIVGGNPAKVIKKRFSEGTINYLLKIRWWDWPIDKMTENVKALIATTI